MLTAASWNLNGAIGDRARRLGQLLARVVDEPPQVVLLQELAPEGVQEFCKAARLDWCVSVPQHFADLLAVRGRDAPGGRRPPRSVAMAGCGDGLRGPVVFPDVPFPEKVLAGWLSFGEYRTTVVSYHAPAGVTHHEKKPAQAVQIARWLTQVRGPVLLGGDFNTPKVDHPDHDQIRTHWHTGDRKLAGALGDDLLVGPNEIHSLRDVLRVWLDDHPEEANSIRHERPKGPLAVSHRTGSGRFPWRYRTRFWTTTDFQVSDVRYFYDEAVAAGTDHALVTARLALRTTEVPSLPTTNA